MSEELRECIELMMERITDPNFSMNDLKKLKSVPSVIDYANSHLRFIGEGSARSVYLLSSRFVLKAARNHAGLGQNEAEIDVFTNPKTKPIIAKIASFDPHYKWLVSELVRPLDEAGFYQLTSVRFESFIEEIDKALDNDDNTSKNKMVTATVDTINQNSLMVADLDHVGHWGKTNDGRVVLLDYGFTRDVMQKHYSFGGDFNKPT